MQQSTVFEYLFNSSIREASYIDIAIGYLLFEVTSNGFSKEETLFDYWDGS